MEKITIIGLDLAKSVFQIHAITEDGHIAVRRALRRSQVLEFFRHIEPCLVGMEACGSAHYWANAIGKPGRQKLPLCRYKRQYLLAYSFHLPVARLLDQLNDRLSLVNS